MRHTLLPYVLVSRSLRFDLSLLLLQPGSIHFAALCFEDAASLGGFFEGLSDRKQLVHFLSAFQSIRRSRLQDIEAAERNLPDLERLMVSRLLPDAEISPILTTVETGTDRCEVEQSLDDRRRLALERLALLCYDPREEALNWWVNNGRLLERSLGIPSTRHVIQRIHVEKEILEV